MVISEQDPNLELHQSDFQDQLDSTVLDRERARCSKVENTFSKKTGRLVNESAHTITSLLSHQYPECIFEIRRGNRTKKQKANIGKKTRRRAVVEETTSSSENEEQVNKRQKTTKKGESKTPEIAVDFEE